MCRLRLECATPDRAGTNETASLKAACRDHEGKIPVFGKTQLTFLDRPTNRQVYRRRHVAPTGINNTPLGSWYGHTPPPPFSVFKNQTKRNTKYNMLWAPDLHGRKSRGTGAVFWKEGCRLCSTSNLHEVPFALISNTLSDGSVETI